MRCQGSQRLFEFGLCWATYWLVFGNGKHLACERKLRLRDATTEQRRINVLS
jgi:hypothetical protein